MSATDGGGLEDREPLNFRVSADVKDAYETAIVQKYGYKHPRAATELEDQLRFALDRGPTCDLFEALSDIGDAVGKAPTEKENLSTPNDESEIVRYRVSKSVRRGIMSLASDANCSNPGEFIERIMYGYATGHSVEERLIDLADRIKEATEYQFDEDLTAVEKRTKGIADELGDEFSLSEFRDAMESGTRGLSCKPIKGDDRKTRKSYLPRVLEETNCSWVPFKNKFLAEDELPPEEHRDPRGKPHLLMDEEDVQFAIKYHAYEESSRLTVSEAVSMLDGRISRDKVKSALQRIGNTSGYNYRPGKDRKKSNADGILRLANQDAVETSEEHSDLQTAHVDLGSAASEDSESDAPLAPTEADRVVDQLPDELSNPSDPIIRNQIAKVTNDTVDRDAKENIADHELEAVSDEQVAYIRDRVADDPEDAGIEDDDPGGNNSETGMQQQSEMDQLASARPTAVTDGGSSDEEDRDTPSR